MAEGTTDAERLAVLEKDLEGLMNQVDLKRKAINDLKDSLSGSNSNINKRRKLNHDERESMKASIKSINQADFDGDDDDDDDTASETNEEISLDEYNKQQHVDDGKTRNANGVVRSVVSAHDKDALDDWANHIYEAVKWERLKSDRLVTVVIKQPHELEEAKKTLGRDQESFFTPALQISGGSFKFTRIGPTAPSGGADFMEAAQFLLASIPDNAILTGNLYCVTRMSRHSIYCDKIEQLEKQFGPVNAKSGNCLCWTTDMLKSVLEKICFAMTRKTENPLENNRRIRVIRVSDASQTTPSTEAAKMTATSASGAAQSVSKML